MRALCAAPLAPFLTRVSNVSAQGSPKLVEFIGQVATWPDGDLFPSFG